MAFYLVAIYKRDRGRRKKKATVISLKLMLEGAAKVRLAASCGKTDFYAENGVGKNFSSTLIYQLILTKANLEVTLLACQTFHFFPSKSLLNEPAKMRFFCI